MTELTLVACNEAALVGGGLYTWGVIETCDKAELTGGG